MEAPWAQFCWGPRASMGPKIGPWYKFSPTWPGPIEGVQDHQDPGLPKAAGEALGDEFSPKGVLNPHLRGFEGGISMSSKLTELTESSSSAPPPSFLCGSGVFSQLFSPSMASSGHFDPFQIYDGYRAVEILDPACTECLAKGKDCFQHYNPQSSKCHHCFIEKKPCRHTGVPSSNLRRYLWSRKDGPFWKEFSVSEAPTPDGTSGFSQCE
ncbi:hypothetical protein O181_123053 [Austropuccinia psidii MF-1]|uniref:Uncharacterized protein n=1 Tax=Austropuccinia psidii MF-1 TaxID=1389203 RepID=A0A9Q3Q2S9_9BASI|nr:hypothetical protein [Austropuccinia psidii MF-1]